MVKFSKQFQAQLVPEWKEAFLDYSQLKKHLNKIHLQITTTTNNTTPPNFFSSICNLSLFPPQPLGPIQVISSISVISIVFILLTILFYLNMFLWYVIGA